jgi:hypothetical protein
MGGLSREGVTAPRQTTKQRYEDGGKATNVSKGPTQSPGRGPRLDGTSSVPDRQVRIPGRRL